MILAFILVMLIGGYTVFISNQTEEQAEELVTKRVGDRLQRLWDDAFDSLKDNKFLRAERALLTILRFDERNSGAYNRLGILYAKQRSFEHSIECFEISHSLEPNASTLHNLGLVYMEVGEYQKAAHTLESAMTEEDDVPTRYIAYAKVQEKLGNEKKMVESLEKAAKLQPNRQTYMLVMDAYRKVGRDEDAAKIESAMKRAKTKIQKAPKIKQPRKVVM
ncbi:tetratricopeptide repeat protein [Candidatus Nomurabacteria bacterium]|nr:tetratricopeptide repeat protein [Candidatus Nomurabacteria bacterium]